MAATGTAIGDLFGPGHALDIATFLKRASFSKKGPGPRKRPAPQKHIFGGLGPMRSDSPVTGPVCISDMQC